MARLKRSLMFMLLSTLGWREGSCACCRKSDSPIESCGIGFKDEPDLIAHAAELGQNFFFAPGGVGRIVKTPVKAVHLSGEHRADLIGIPADGDDGIDGAAEEFLKMLGVMAGYVDTDLLHDLDGLRMDIPGRLRAGAGNFDQIGGGSAEDAFGQVTAAGVASAKNEDKWFGGHMGEGNWE